jgi:hypothetical protein
LLGEGRGEMPYLSETIYVQCKILAGKIPEMKQIQMEI